MKWPSWIHEMVKFRHAVDVPLGVTAGTQVWSPDSRFLVTLNENMPHTLWVWDLASMELASLITHVSHIKDVKWAPQVGLG